MKEIHQPRIHQPMGESRRVACSAISISALVALLVMSCGDGGGGGDDGGADAGDAGDPCTSDGEWYDEHTGLCWQDPPGDSLMIQDEAIAHCDDLVLGGRDDWRLPRIQELIALVRGCGRE
jgi:hypothetical protein